MATFDQRGQHVGQQYNVAGDLHMGAAQPREADAARETAAPPPVDVIITPLEEERDAVLAKLDGPRQLPPTQDDIRVYYAAELPVTFPDGAAATYRVVVVPLLNMGRVEAANATGDAIQRWRPRYVWLVGIAGGLAKAGVALGDVLVADQIADYELQKLTPEGPSIRWRVHRVDPRLLGAARNLRGDGWLRGAAAAHRRDLYGGQGHRQRPARRLPRRLGQAGRGGNGSRGHGQRRLSGRGQPGVLHGPRGVGPGRCRQGLGGGRPVAGLRV